MRLFIVLCCIAFAGGCANKQFYHPGKTQADFEQDIAECKYEASKATAGGGTYGMSTAFGQGLAEGLEQRDLIVQCMGVRGYTLRDAP